MTEPRAWAPVRGGLSAAAQRILRVVERTVMLRVAEVTPEQQSAALQKQLAAAATEIFLILENLMGEYEAELSRYCDKDRSPEQHTCERSSIPRQVEKMPSHPDKGASGETDPGVQRGAVSPSEARSEDTQVTTPKSNKGGTCRRLRQSHGADCCKVCGRSFHREATAKKTNTEAVKGAATNKGTGQRCCRVCGKCFQYKQSFFKHVLKHEHSADMCGVCGKRLDSVESLKVHLQAHSEGNCRREQTGEGADGVTGETNRASRSQKTESKSTTEALNAAETKDGQGLPHIKYCCKVCSKAFCYRASFLRHVQEDERDTDVCGVCGKHHETLESLRLHLQTHVRASDCEVCGKHFDGLKQLEMHMRTHTGEKPYVCSICGKAFAQNGNLMGHMRAHTGEKPYACSVCGQSFGFKEYMVSHMRIHTGDKPFLCSVCGKGFRQRGTLKTHAMIHTGQSAHRCSVCDKTLYKRGALKVHMRSHTGEKPYLCNICGKRFTAGSSLSKHMGVCSKRGLSLSKEDLEKGAESQGNKSTHLSL